MENRRIPPCPTHARGAAAFGYGGALERRRQEVYRCRCKQQRGTPEGRSPTPIWPTGRPSGSPPLTDEAGVYLPTGPGDAQRMELLNMPGDGSDVWLDVRTVQLYLQISLMSIYRLIRQDDLPIMASCPVLAISQNLGDNV